jgi:hypothetical protein
LDESSRRRGLMGAGWTSKKEKVSGQIGTVRAPPALGNTVE